MVCLSATRETRGGGRAQVYAVGNAARLRSTGLPDGEQPWYRPPSAFRRAPCTGASCHRHRFGHRRGRSYRADAGAARLGRADQLLQQRGRGPRSEAACRDAGADTLLPARRRGRGYRCNALAEAAIGPWGRLDALVNNAGITTSRAAATGMRSMPHAFGHIMGVNVLGTFQMVRACVPHLKAAAAQSSMSLRSRARLGIGSSVPYIASKGAINSMTLHLRARWRPTFASTRSARA